MSFTFLEGKVLEDGARKTVVHIAQFASPYPGNFIASLRALEAPLREAGLGQALVLPHGARAREWAHVCQLGDTALYFLPPDEAIGNMSSAIAGIALREDAAILHTHFGYDRISLLAQAQLLIRGRKTPLVWHVHSEGGPTSVSFRRRLRSLIKLRLLTLNVQVVTVSDRIKMDLVARGLPAVRAHVVPNGIDVDRALLARRPRTAVREELGISQSAMVCLLFGYDPITKGVDVAMDAIEQIASNGTNLILLLVGHGKMMEFLGARLPDGMPAWLRVTPSTESIGDMYQAADVFLSTSRSEGFAYAVGEALVNGLPVVASDIPGHAWSNQIPGVAFFSPGDVQSLTQTIRAVAHWDPADRSIRMDRSRQYVDSNLSVGLWANRIVALYRDILGDGGFRQT